MIITVCNQKGGCAKTTTAWHILAGLNKRGVKALAIDFDPQSSLSYRTGAKLSEMGVEALCEDYAMKLVQHCTDGDIIISSQGRLCANYGADQVKRAIKPLQDEYDVIIIDTPPQMSNRLILALMVSDYALIVGNSAGSSIEGVAELSKTIQAVQKQNNKLKIAGALFTRVNTRSRGDAERMRAYREMLPQINIPVFDTYIRQSVAVVDSEDAGQTLFDYAPKTIAAQDYEQFINELIERVKI